MFFLKLSAISFIFVRFLTHCQRKILQLCCASCLFLFSIGKAFEKDLMPKLTLGTGEIGAFFVTGLPKKPKYHSFSHIFIVFHCGNHQQSSDNFIDSQMVLFN